MKEKLAKKLLVFGTIILFFGAGVTLNIFVKNVRADPGEIFYPTDDATIHCNAPDYNDGSSDKMTVRNMYGHPSHPTYWERDPLVKFDISSIPSGSTINSATLKLYYYYWWDNNPAGHDLKLYKITSSWDEDTVTWNTQPSYASQPTTYSTVPSSTGVWMEWDVTSDVQDFVDGDATNYGWKITDEYYWGKYNIPITYFRSKEYGDYIPCLEIAAELENQPPVANAGPDQTVEQTSYEGAEVTLDGSGSYDPDEDPLTYEWTWNDGSATGVNPSAIFPLGRTIVTLTVSDGSLTDSDTVEITVEDTTPPKIIMQLTPSEFEYGYKYMIYEGDTINVTDLADKLRKNGDIAIYQLNKTTGKVNKAYTRSLEGHPFCDIYDVYHGDWLCSKTGIYQGSFEYDDTMVALNPKTAVLVKDDDGDNMSVTFSTNVSGTWETFDTFLNVLPNTFVLSNNITNMDEYETYYWIKVNISDGIHNTVQTVKFMTRDYMNRSPIANVSGPYESYEGKAITFDASNSTDPDDDDLQYLWDFNNDSIWDTNYSLQPTATYTWDDDYTGDVVLEVYDGNMTDADTTSVMVNNVAPSVYIDNVSQPFPEFILTNDTLQFNGSYYDPGILDTHTIEWNFGDGNISTDTLTTAHAYAEPGNYTVTLNVTDDDGGMGTTSVTICVETQQEAIEDVIEDIEEMDLPPWKNSLIIKLENAIDALNKNNTGAAINKLEAFINQVEAKRGKGLTEEQADALIAAAKWIIDNINE